MDDLIAFLCARLDEDERMARVATPGPWHIPEHDPLFYCVDSPDGSGRICKFGDRACSEDVYNSLHIARHDPARVLREVAALRAILAQWEHSPAGSPVLTNALYQLAAVYSDHPGYRAEWKP